MTPYQDGYKSGRADALLNRRSLYAWVAFAGDPTYHQEYSKGYRKGWTEQWQKGAA